MNLQTENKYLVNDDAIVDPEINSDLIETRDPDDVPVVMLDVD